MRAALALVALLMLLAACQSAVITPPGGDRPTPFHDKYGGMCSPYSMSCW